MGVEGSTKLLGDGNSVGLNGFGSIVIDGNLLTFKLGKAQPSVYNITKNSDGDDILSCCKILDFILLWLEKYVIESYQKGNGCTVPIFVFDGKAPKGKQQTIKKRKEKQQKSQQRLDDITDAFKKLTLNCDKESEYDGDDDTSTVSDVISVDTDNQMKELYFRHLRNSYNPGNEIPQIILLLKSMGIPVISAPSEGDSQCAALSMKFGTSTITDDIDIILLGSQSICKIENMRTLALREYKMSNILQNMRTRLVSIINMCDNDRNYPHRLSSNMFKDSNNNVCIDFTLDDLRGISCLLGTDYCPGLKIDRTKISINAAILLYFQNNRNIKLVLEYVRTNRLAAIKQMERLKFFDSISDDFGTKKNIDQYIETLPKITDQYIERMIGAYNQYNSDNVYDLPDNAVRIAEPNITNLVGQCTTFLNKDKAFVTRVIDIVKKAHDTYLKYETAPNLKRNVGKNANDRQVSSSPSSSSSSSVPPTANFRNYDSYHRRCDRIGQTPKSSNGIFKHSRQNIKSDWRIKAPETQVVLDQLQLDQSNRASDQYNRKSYSILIRNSGQ